MRNAALVGLFLPADRTNSQQLAPIGSKECGIQASSCGLMASNTLLQIFYFENETLHFIRMFFKIQHFMAKFTVFFRKIRHQFPALMDTVRNKCRVYEHQNPHERLIFRMGRPVMHQLVVIMQDKGSRRLRFSPGNIAFADRCRKLLVLLRGKNISP